MSNFETIIGIEIHLALNTKTKMFSSSLSDANSEPNTNITGIDLGYPGTLPTVNKSAVEKAIKLAKSLNMKIDPLVRFDRKHYFYPDLPKGFQITQFYHPIGSNGFVPTRSGKKISIERIHLEEDTAKSNHVNGNTLLDYNRAGVPLIEIVTDPVMRSADEMGDYINAIRQLALSLDISDAKMEDGSLRVDVNISIRPFGQKTFNPKVEIKNINSVANAKKAVEAEIIAQRRAILSNEKVVEVTKRFDEATQGVKLMRNKGDAIDYRYFPEPNIPPIQLDKEFIDNIINNELPWEQRERYRKSGITEEFIDKLQSDFEKAKWFDSIKYKNVQMLGKVFFAEIVSLANSKDVTIEELNINKDELAKALNYLEEGHISGPHIKKIIPLLSSSQKKVDQIIEENNLKLISDEVELTKIIKQVMENNYEFIEKNSGRYERVSKFLSGNVMKQTRGQANPIVLANIIKKLI